MNIWVTRVGSTYWWCEGNGRLKLTKDQCSTLIANHNQAWKAWNSKSDKAGSAEPMRPRNLAGGSDLVTDIADVTESSSGSLALMGVDLSKYQ